MTNCLSIFQGSESIFPIFWSFGICHALNLCDQSLPAFHSYSPMNSPLHSNLHFATIHRFRYFHFSSQCLNWIHSESANGNILRFWSGPFLTYCDCPCFVIIRQIDQILLHSVHQNVCTLSSYDIISLHITCHCGPCCVPVLFLEQLPIEQYPIYLSFGMAHSLSICPWTECIHWAYDRTPHSLPKWTDIVDTECPPTTKWTTTTMTTYRAH